MSDVEKLTLALAEAKAERQVLMNALKEAQETILAVAGKATDRGTQRFLIGEYNRIKAVLK